MLSVSGLCLVLFVQAQVAKPFSIKGNITGIPDGWIQLGYTLPQGERVLDSTQIKGGAFSFSGSISETVMAWLQVKGTEDMAANSLQFLLEPAVLSMKLGINDFQHAEIKGSSLQHEFTAFQQISLHFMEQLKPYNAQYDSIAKLYRQATVAKATEQTLQVYKDQMDAIREKMSPISGKIYDAQLDFFRSHPTSLVTAWYLQFHVSRLPVDSLQKLYDALGHSTQQSHFGQSIKEEIDDLRSGSPGSTAKNFTATDINGHALSLNDFKGQYVLLDFWASWCGPCRKGNPHLKALYAKYHENGIEFVGVSDDDSKPDAWRKAVETDGLPWRHVLRGFDRTKLEKGEVNENDISKKFGIHLLPTKILIDRNGMIIGRYNEEEEALDKQLEEIFGK